MPLQIGNHFHGPRSKHSQTPLPVASDITLAALTALMLRRTRIKSAREAGAVETQNKLHADEGCLPGRADQESQVRKD